MNHKVKKEQFYGFSQDLLANSVSDKRLFIRVYIPSKEVVFIVTMDGGPEHRFDELDEAVDFYNSLPR